MAWIIFDEADHYAPAPDFCLVTNLGNRVCLRDYQEDCNLALVFLPAQPVRGVPLQLSEFSARCDEYLSFDAKILAVLQGDQRPALGPGAEAACIPLLLDRDGRVRQAYAGLMAASLTADDDLIIFVLDRYNAPYAAWIGKELGDPALHQEVQSWLAFIGIQCPE